MKTKKDNYTNLYSKQNSNNLWPTEFAVRAILGRSYNFEKSYNLKNALDLGFGDGRNLKLLQSVSNNVYGLEISEEICKKAAINFPEIKFIDGFSHSIDIKDNFFSLILAVHSIYYCDKAPIEDNFSEVNRILEPKGRVIISIPKSNSYLIKNSKKLPNNYVSVLSDPLNIRNGYILKYFLNSNDLEDFLIYLNFEDIHIGSCESNWWGINEFYWIVSCQKK